MKISTNFKLPKKLYDENRKRVLKTLNITMTEFIVRCMLLALEDEFFIKMIEDDISKYYGKLLKEYK